MDRIDPELLKRYADGSCTDEERAIVEEWLDKEDNLFDQEAEPLPQYQLDKQKRALWNSFVEKAFLYSARLRWWRWSLYVSLLVLTGLAIQSIFHTIQIYKAPVVMHTQEVPPGKNLKLVLPDSSTVWLAGGSTLRYPETFADSLRELNLVDGEIYLHVVQKKNQPFRLITDGAVIQVLGTRFYVENRQHNTRMRIALEEGSIRFSRGTSRQLLQPGDQLSYWKADSTFEMHRIAPTDIARWSNGLIQFNHTVLQEALEKLENHYGVRFLIEGNPNLKQPITGKFDNLPLSRVLHLMEGVTNLHFKQEGKTIKIN
ncbi:FecR domain-containing protein [Olivibacter ginsenosidimutans]|uniref:FecR domain-containing protein n=1 Tax=Olivibacter ginsenosidimutans TaxID=1176537 RepID=A0ABP9AD51_9SPHI